MTIKCWIGLCVLPFLFFGAGCAGFGKPGADDRLDALQAQAKEKEQQEAWDSRKLAPDRIALARDLMDKGYYDIALAELQRAEKSGRPRADVQHLMGLCARETGRIKEAEALFSKALSADPDFAPAYNGIGTVAAIANDTETTLDAFRRAVSLDPARADFQNNLGFALLVAEDRYAEAERLFRRSLELKPGFEIAAHNLALALVLQGRDPEALTVLTSISSPAQAYHNMGKILQVRGETEKAEAMLARAARLDPHLGAQSRTKTQGLEPPEDALNRVRFP